MATWPTTLPKPRQITEGYLKAAHRSSSESGYVHTRAKHTKSRKSFVLSWPDMLTAEKDILETFFDANQGATFTWPHPVSGQYTCIFSEDNLSFESQGFSDYTGIYSIAVKIEEP